MSQARANIRAEVSADTTRFQGAMRRAQSSAQAAGRRIAGAMKGASMAMVSLGAVALKTSARLGALAAPILAATGALGGLAGAAKAVTAAADMETLTVSFETMAGSAERGRMAIQSIADLAAKTPFEFPDLANAGKILLAFGTRAEDLSDTLRQLGDVAAGAAVPIEDMAQIYGKNMATGVIQGQDLMQLAERGIPVFEQFAKQLGVGQDQIRKMASEGKITFPMLQQALKDMTSDGGQFFRMMEKQSATFNGKLSTLKDNITAAFRAIGNQINDRIKPIMDDLIAKIQAVDWEGIANRIGSLFDRVMAGFNMDNIIRLVSESVPVIVAILGDAFAKAMDVGKAIMNSLFTDEGLSFVYDSLIDVFVAAFDFIGEAANNLGKIIAAALKGEVTFVDDTRIIGDDSTKKKAPKTYAQGLAEELSKIDFAPSDSVKAAVDKFKSAFGEIFPEVARKTGSAFSSEASLYDKELEEQRRRMAEDAAAMAPVDVFGPSKDVLFAGVAKERQKWLSMFERYSESGFKGLAENAKMQLQRTIKAPLGSDNIFARDRARLGLASGLTTGGLGATRKIGRAKDEEAAKRQEELAKDSNEHLVDIKTDLSRALSVA